MVTHQLQVERTTAKAHRPKTNALPLDHATNFVLYVVCVAVRAKSLDVGRHVHGVGRRCSVKRAVLHVLPSGDCEPGRQATLRRLAEEEEVQPADASGRGPHTQPDCEDRPQTVTAHRRRESSATSGDLLNTLATFPLPLP